MKSWIQDPLWMPKYIWVQILIQSNTEFSTCTIIVFIWQHNILLGLCVSHPPEGLVTLNLAIVGISVPQVPLWHTAVHLAKDHGVKGLEGRSSIGRAAERSKSTNKLTLRTLKVLWSHRYMQLLSCVVLVLRGPWMDKHGNPLKPFVHGVFIWYIYFPTLYHYYIPLPVQRDYQCSMIGYRIRTKMALPNCFL